MIIPKSINYHLMRKSFLIFLFVNFCIFHIQAQAKKPWSKNCLTWADFIGPNDPSSSYFAHLKSGVEYNYRVQKMGDNFRVLFSVNANMLPEQSWVVPEQEASYLLQHEQLHFDISEVFSRVLLKSLQKRGYSQNFAVEIKTTADSVNSLREKMEDDYDEQTNHSLNKEQQSKWNQKVKQMLQSN